MTLRYNPTYRALVLLLMLLGIGNLASSQSTLWERNARSDAQQPRPTWFGSGTERGIALGMQGTTQVLYVASRNGGNSIRMINANTGVDITDGPTFDLSGVSGGTFVINDISTTSDGKILVTNMTTDARSEASPFKIYVFNPTGGAPIHTHSYLATGAVAVRLGDKVSVVGSWDAGTVEVWASAGFTSPTPGIVVKLTTANQGGTWTSTVTTLSASVAADAVIPANSNVFPAHGSLFINGNGGLVRRYNPDGVFQVGQTSGYTSSNSGVKAFSSGGRNLIAIYAYRPGSASAGDLAGYVAVYDVTTPTMPVFLGRSAAMSTATAAAAVNGDVAVRMNEDHTYTVYGLATDQGLIATTFPAPPTTVLAWDTQGIPNEAIAGPLAPTATATNISSSGISRGTGLTATALTNGFSASGWTQTTAEGAMTAGTFFEIPVDIAPGFKLSLSDAYFLFRRSSSGPNRLQLAYSTNGTDFTLVGSAIEYAGTEDGFPFGPFNLGGISALQNVTHATRVTFRLLGWGASATTGTGALARQAGPEFHLSGRVEIDETYVPPSNYVAMLSGLQENPPVVSGGTGSISAVLNGDQFVVTGQFSNLNSTYTSSHIHTGATGTNGGVVFALTPSLAEGGLAGTYEAASNTFTTTEAQKTALANGTWYVNVHSTTSPGGEIRGQLLLSPNAAPTTADPTFPSPGAQITLSGFSGTPFSPAWTTSTDADGQAVTYVWQLMTQAGAILHQVKTTATTTTLTFAQIDALLAANGVEAGGSANLKHRVAATDGSAISYGDEFAVTMVRGTLSSTVTIAEAYALPNNTTGVTIEAVVTRVRGREARIQDATGGFSIFLGSTGTYFDMVATGAVRKGDLIRITGRRTAFSGLNQLDQISALDVLSRDQALPEPALVTLADLRDNGPQYESRLVRVTGITVNPAGDVNWSAGTGSGKTYQITDATVTTPGVVDFRVPNAVNTNLVGDPIPEFAFEFVGVLGRFNAVFQLYAVDKTDIVYSPPALAGLYAIPQVGSEPGFPSLSAAVAALNTRGALAPVTFQINADLVDTNAVIRIDRADLTPETSLTIVPGGVGPRTVHIRQLHNFATPYVYILGYEPAEDDGEVLLKAAALRKTVSQLTPDRLDAVTDHISDGEFGPRNLTFNLATATAPNAAIFLQGKVESNLIMSVNVTMSGTQGTNIPAFLLNRLDAAGPGQGGLTDVMIVNVGIGSPEAVGKFKDGFQIFGSSTGVFPNDGILLWNNELHVGHRGLSTQMVRDNSYIGNTVWIYGIANQTAHIGFNINTPVGQLLLMNNRFLQFRTNRSAATDMIGLNLTNSLNDQGVFIVNNYIAMNHSKASGVTGEADRVIGIAHSGTASVAQFFVVHNTIRIPNTTQTGLHAGLTINGGSATTRFEVQNNIIVNEKVGGFGIHWTGSNLMSDHNNYVASTLVRRGAVDHTTVASLRASGHDAKSVSQPVQFVSATDLSLTGSSLGDPMLAGMDLGIYSDINGTTRSRLAPYMGAFEGPPIPVVATDFDLLTPDGGSTLVLTNDPNTNAVFTWEQSYSTEAWGGKGFTLFNDAYAHAGNGANGLGKYVGSDNNAPAILTTPVLQDVGEIGFWIATYNNQTVLKVTVELTTDGENWTAIETFDAVEGGTGDINIDWQYKLLEIYEDIAMVRFVVSGSPTIAGSVYFDDFEVFKQGSWDTTLDESFETWTSFRKLTYTWHLDTPNGNFSNPRLSILSDDDGSEPSLTISHTALEAALAGIGVPAGLSFNGKWTVTANVGSTAKFAERTRALTIQRYVDVAVEEAQAPLTYRLEQNYPNPFNPSTAITYSVPNTGKVTLSVYTVTGQLVATLVDDVKAPGVYSVNFDASRLASGVYLYRIVADGFTQTHKMTLVK